MGAKKEMFTLSIPGTKDEETNKIKLNFLAIGNKVDIIEAIIMLLRDKEANELQVIFTEVNEYI